MGVTAERKMIGECHFVRDIIRSELERCRPAAECVDRVRKDQLHRSVHPDYHLDGCSG